MAGIPTEMGGSWEGGKKLKGYRDMTSLAPTDIGARYNNAGREKSWDYFLIWQVFLYLLTSSVVLFPSL